MLLGSQKYKGEYPREACIIHAKKKRKKITKQTIKNFASHRLRTVDPTEQQMVKPAQFLQFKQSWQRIFEVT